MLPRHQQALATRANSTESHHGEKVKEAWTAAQAPAKQAKKKTTKLRRHIVVPESATTPTPTAGANVMTGGVIDREVPEARS